MGYLPSQPEEPVIKPLQTVRYGCYECMIVFDLAVAPPTEWVEQYEDEDGNIDTEPIMCPFCGSAELKPQHDQPIVT
jgi:hypothetical protein